MKCVYCENQEIRKRVIIKNELAWAFPTNIPIVPGHTLIAPIRCVARYEDLTEAELSSIRDLTLKIQHALKNVFGAEGYNFAWNEGDLAGQSIPHFHLHVLPRKQGDTGIAEYEPRKFLYRPGSREATPEAELQAVSDMIRSAM